MIFETRTTIPEVPPDLMQRIDLRDEGLRLAQFRYSAQVLAGSRADWRYIEESNTESDHD